MLHVISFFILRIKDNPDDCCFDDCGAPGASSTQFCTSPFTNFTLWIKHGHEKGDSSLDRECPDNEVEYNCNNLSLKGLRAIYLAFKYSFTVSKEK